MRILEAANANSFLCNLNLGYVTDRGLKIMAKCLKMNKNLSKLKFTEHQDHPWSEVSKQEFIEMLKQHQNLVKVKFDGAVGSDNEVFEQEIKFYVHKIKKGHKDFEAGEERKESCTNEHLFNNLLRMIEDKNEH